MAEERFPAFAPDAGLWEKAGWDGFLLCRLNQVDPVIMGALHLTSWVQGYSEGGALWMGPSK